MRQTTTTDLDAEVKRLLEAKPHDWAAIAEKSGVSHSWIHKFVKYGIDNPGYRTLVKIRDAVNALEHAAARKAKTTADRSQRPS